MKHQALLERKQALRSGLLAACCAFLLAGCSDAPDATDEELITLLAEKQWTLDRDQAPWVIPLKIEECASILSGLNAEITKDAPAEMIGAFKTECRKKLDTLLKDTTRNTKGFELKHFESKKLAQRIIEARKASLAIAEAYDEEKKKKP